MIDNLLGDPEIIAYTLTVIAGLFAFLKWFDSRNMQLRQARFESYMELIRVVGGKTKSGDSVGRSEQIAAVWFLSEYREFMPITKRIFSESEMSKPGAKSGWTENIKPHIAEMIRESDSTR